MVVSFSASMFKKALFMVLMVLMFVSVMSFTHNNSLKLQKERETLSEIAREVLNYQGTVETESFRKIDINKIIGIIGRYNRTMSGSLKYDIAREIQKMSVKYSNLDINLICATITHESARSWRPDVVSHAGALGLMQIMPYTAKLLVKPEGIKWTFAKEVLFNPITNIRMGCRYLSMLIELYNVDGGLAAYNGGPRRAKKWIASGRNYDILLEETRYYVPAVLELYHHYKSRILLD